MALDGMPVNFVFASAHVCVCVGAVHAPSALRKWVNGPRTTHRTSTDNANAGDNTIKSKMQYIFMKNKWQYVSNNKYFHDKIDRCRCTDQQFQQ